MYTFVFMWTPALEEEAKLIGMSQINHGLIFAIFMVSAMVGSTLVNEFNARNIEPLTYMCYVFPIAALALTPAMVGAGGFWGQMIGFCVSEACVGIYFPTWGTVKAGIIPEEFRATVMNLYRVPLNF